MPTTSESTSSTDTIVTSAAAMSKPTINIPSNGTTTGEINQIENAVVQKIVSTSTTTELKTVAQTQQPDTFNVAETQAAEVRHKPPRYSSIYGGENQSGDVATGISVRPLTLEELQTQNTQLKQQVAHLTGLMQRLLEQQTVHQPHAQHQTMHQPQMQIVQQPIQQTMHQPQMQPQTVQQPIQQTHMSEQPTLNRHYYDRLPIPTFSRDNVEMWFFQLETWFNRRNIANDDAAKYDTLVAALDTNLLTQVAGVLRSVIHGNKYAPLKKAIIANFADSETQQLRKLLAGTPRGTNKPTALLNIMRNIFRNPNAEQLSLIRHFWLDQMPTEVCAVIVGNKANAVHPENVSLDDEATLADVIIEALDRRNTKFS